VDNGGESLKLQKADLAVSGIAGLEVVLLRRVAAFIEVGYRRASLECSQAGYTLHGFLALGGFRLGL
jgi:hypothetical protein